MSVQIIKGLIFCILVAPVPADALDPSGLLNNNPFLAPASANTQAQSAQPLELRGVVFENGIAWFTLFDAAAKKWTTVRQGEEGDAFVVRSYDQAQDTVILDIRGSRVTLSLKAAGNQSFGRSGVVAKVASAAPQFRAQPTMVPPLCAAEVERLDLVASALRQRLEDGKRKIASPALKDS